MINTSSLAPSVALYKRPSSSSRRAFLYKYKNFVCTSSLPSSLFVFLFTHPVYPDKHLCGFIFQSHSLTTNKSSRTTTTKHQPTNQHGRELSWWAAKCEISFRWQTAAGICCGHDRRLQHIEEEQQKLPLGRRCYFNFCNGAIWRSFVSFIVPINSHYVRRPQQKLLYP